MESADRVVVGTLEIIDYFQPRLYFIENPWTGRLKTRPCMLDQPSPYVVDYCRYGLPYRKRTAIWSNCRFFMPKLCDRNCGGFSDGRHGLWAQRGSCFTQEDLYRIPRDLVIDIFRACELDLFQSS